VSGLNDIGLIDDLDDDDIADPVALRDLYRKFRLNQ